MKYRTRTFYTNKQKSEMWDRWQRSIPSHLQQVRWQDSVRVTEAVIETRNQVPNPNPINIAKSDRSAPRFTCNVDLSQDAGTSGDAGHQ